MNWIIITVLMVIVSMLVIVTMYLVFMPQRRGIDVDSPISKGRSKVLIKKEGIISEAVGYTKINDDRSILKLSNGFKFPIEHRFLKPAFVMEALCENKPLWEYDENGKKNTETSESSVDRHVGFKGLQTRGERELEHEKSRTNYLQRNMQKEVDRIVRATTDIIKSKSSDDNKD